MQRIIGRRRFIESLAGLGAANLVTSSVLGAQQNGGEVGRPSGRLPARTEFVVRNAYVLTMDPTLGDLPDGDVHVKNGEIIAVGKNVKAPGATVIDGRKMILLPGLIETHWHMWTTLQRGLSGDRAVGKTPGDNEPRNNIEKEWPSNYGYFPMSGAYGMAMKPDDMYYGTLLGATEALYSGMTTVHDWCHNCRSHDHAVADMRALKDVGIRARWSYGPYRGMPAGTGIDLADIERLHQDWANYSNDGLISLGVSLSGATSPEALKRSQKEFETARRLGLPMAAHVADSDDARPGQLEALAKENMLGKDLLLSHMLGTTPAEIEKASAAGSPISVSPGTELRIGFGTTKTAEFLDAGAVVSVSIDCTPLIGNVNLFGILKLMRNAANGKAHDEFKISARRALEIGTIDGARSLGIDNLVGSLKPGKRADLVMVATNHLTMGLFTDPTHMLVESTEEADVDTVVVDGRILKRAGKLTALVPEQIIAGASTSLDGVRKRINAA